MAKDGGRYAREEGSGAILLDDSEGNGEWADFWGREVDGCSAVNCVGGAESGFALELHTDFDQVERVSAAAGYNGSYTSFNKTLGTHVSGEVMKEEVFVRSMKLLRL